MANEQPIMRQGGWFEAAGRRLLGELTIDGPQTNLFVHDPEFFRVTDNNCRCILGTLHDLRKVTLVNCHTKEMGVQSEAKERFHYQRITPHYVLLGHQHLDPDETVITHVSLLVDDAEAVFPDFDAFGTTSQPEKHIDALAKDYEAAIGRPVRLGPSPRVHFFGGQREIISVDTDIGRVSVCHRHTLGNSSYLNDFAFHNRTWLELQFEKPQSFEAAIQRATVLLRFIEIMAGRPQNLEQMSIHIPSECCPSNIDVHWLFSPKRSRDWENGRISPIDLLINPISDQSAFETVLKRWVEMDAERRLARIRFSHWYAKQRIFDPDRLVAAANMFDLLPDTALPGKPTLSDDLLQAKAAAKAAFEQLPNSHEREAILDALGRIGKQSLRRKILHRAQLVNARIYPRLEHLDLVVGEAVRMRNYFVHGSKQSFDYRQFPGMSSFFAEALEFIFTTLNSP